MKSPEHFKSVTSDIENPDDIESQIKSLKQEGRKCVFEIQQIIAKGEVSTDPEERAKLKQLAESQMRDLIKLKRKLRILTGEEIESFFTHEQYLSDLHPSLLKTYKKWSYSADQLKTVESVTLNPDNIHIDEPIPYDEMVEINKDSSKTETNKSQTGELYITSESIDYENAKPFIPEIPDDIKKQGVSGVMKYIHETYADTHSLPDMKYYQYLAELGDKYQNEDDPAKKETLLKQIPEQLKDGNYYYFPGSALVFGSGHWIAPFLNWDGGRFNRNASRVGSSWDSSRRVLLLER